MQAVMPARLMDSMPPMLPMCPAPQSAASGAADLLSQCTTEWSRYFIASRIAPCEKYTAALTADLQQHSEPAAAGYNRPGNNRPNLTVKSPDFDLDDSPSSSSLESLSTSPVTSDGCAGGDPSPLPLRKVASCAVTARERSRKRVQFADEVGQALTRVRFLCDPSHLPLGGESCQNGVSGETAVSGLDVIQQPQHQSDSQQTQLKCKFSQPSSRYIVFRESVERNLVCLSLVHLDFATIRGAIAVKNVGFRKRVFARVTFDSWRSFRDVEAAYNGSEGHQDNFAFSVHCPRDQTADIQFCVCFECESGSYWDNNGGENYRVAVGGSAANSADSGYTRDFKPNYRGVNEFSEFSAWEHFTDRVYY